MKQSDIKAGKTYRGRDGGEREVLRIEQATHFYRGRNHGMRLFVAFKPAEHWWRDRVLLSTFARWAVEEVGG